MHLRSRLLSRLAVLADTVATLALLEEDAEPLKVTELAPLLEGSTTTSPAAGGPLLCDPVLCELLGHSPAACTARERLGHKRRERKVLVRVRLARNRRLRVVDQCLRV